MARLTLEIQSVRCRDETGGMFQEKIGGDEIALAGLTIDPEATVEPLRTFSVGRFGKDGDEKTFNPRKVLASFDLEKGPPFPRLYQVMLILAERDSSGGLEAHVKNVVEETRKNPPEVAFSAGVATAVALEVAKEVGKVAFAAAKKAIKTALKDDIFPPHLEGLRIGRADFRFPGGKPTSRPKRVEVAAANGKYQITFLWRLSDK